MERSKRVRQAAVRLFAERGFHGTGIRDLAEAAGLSSATLYHYMGTKEELLVQVMKGSLEHLVARARQVVSEYDDPAAQLEALVAMHVREHAELRLETTVVDGEIRALSADHLAEVLALRDAYEAVWQDVLETGQRDGSFALEDVRLARIAVLDMCSGISRWYAPGGRLGVDDLATSYVHMVGALVGARRRGLARNPR